MTRKLIFSLPITLSRRPDRIVGSRDSAWNLFRKPWALARGASFVCLFVLFGLVNSSFAAFSISATPYEGTTELNFRASPGVSVEAKELKIIVTTDIAKQYEVRQEFIAPVTNGRGDELSWNDFSLYGLLGSNASGTFNVASASPVGTLPSISLLYTSNSSGPADEFILVYNLTVPLGTPAGSYRGQARFILNAIDASQSPVFAFLNFVVEVGATPTPEAKPLIEITPSASLKTIYLNAKKEETKTADVFVKINGQFKNLFSLAQFLTNPLQSNEGNQLDYAAVNFIVRDATKGLPVNVETGLSASFQNIYASEANGDADNEFTITYSLGDLSSQKAGRYTSNIQYYLEETGVQEKLETLELVVENERIFDLLLTAQDQKSLIEFRNIRPGQEPRINEVTIEIKTNTGKQYQVSQNVYSALTSKEGSAIPAEYFTLRTDGLDAKGELKCAEKQVVKIGDTTLFVSDAGGLPAKFKVIYELNIPKGLNIKIGDYSTRITYTLLEI